MLVSAISANYNQKTRAVNYGYINSRGGDSNVDNSTVKQPDSNAETLKSINEWKAFCHRQILGGKLDIIA